MPKLRHIHLKEYPYMTTSVVADRKPLFNDSNAADMLLEAVFFGRSKRWYYLLSFVIMSDHMHLIVIPEEKNISEIMKSIKGFSAREINKVSGNRGSIWQEGFYDYILDSEEKVLSRMRYIEDNPVRRGMVKCADEYRYSSVRYRERTDFKRFF